MQITVNIHEAKTRLSRLLVRVVGGEEIINAKAGKPIARLVPFEASPTARAPGSARGKMVIPPDFEDSLLEETLEGFEGRAFYRGAGADGREFH